MDALLIMTQNIKIEKIMTQNVIEKMRARLGK